MTSLTFIAPDGRLYTRKKYVNWEGVREVEGSSEINLAYGNSLPETATLAPASIYENVYIDFTIQD